MAPDPAGSSSPSWRGGASAESPLRGLIRTPTVTSGLIKDNSLIKMLENSLSDGLLFRFRAESGEGGDAEAMLAPLKDFWAAVAEVFWTVKRCSV